MKILFIDPNIEGYTGMPGLPFAILKAYIKETSAHQVKILDLGWHKKVWQNHIKQTIEEFKPDLIGFSVLSFNYNQALKIAAFIKSLFDVRIIFGGIHVILSPEDVIQNKWVDIICTGEGEVSLKNILDNNLNCQDIPGVWYKDNDKIIRNPKTKVTEQLDELPFPDWDDFELEKYFIVNNNHLPVMASRGCPYPCTYCSNRAIASALQGKYVRFRSVDNVLDEIGVRIEQYLDKGLRYIFFYDDIFILKKDFILEFCKKFKERKYHQSVSWNANVRANLVTDEIIAAMKDAGCYGVRMGVESANDFVRNEIYERKMSKKEIYNAAEIIHKYGLQLRIQFIIGSPYETIEMMEENFTMARRINADYELFPILMPLPGTKMKELCEREGLIEKKRFQDSYSMYTSPVARTKYITSNQIKKFARKTKNYQIKKCFFEGLSLRGPVFLWDLLVFLVYYKPKYQLHLNNAYRFTVGKYKLEDLV